MSKGTTVFVVEGAVREVQLVAKIADRFFSGKNHIEIYCLPANDNIYVLWNKLKDDDFETDIVELIRYNIPQAAERLKGVSRQDIDEVYLFFDYDAQQRNLPQGVNAHVVLEQMLEAFDNETENGKLYISYPMVEALRDFTDDSCRSLTNCVVDLRDFKTYKHATGEINRNLSDGATWKSIMQTYIMRVNCLFDNQSIDFETYKKQVSPRTIYAKQIQKYIPQDRVFVLSAFPEFLLDYNQPKFWNVYTKRQHPIRNCKLK